MPGICNGVHRNSCVVQNLQGLTTVKQAVEEGEGWGVRKRQSERK